MKNSCREVYLSKNLMAFLAIVLKEISVVFNEKNNFSIKFNKFLFIKKELQRAYFVANLNFSFFIFHFSFLL